MRVSRSRNQAGWQGQEGIHCLQRRKGTCKPKFRAASAREGCCGAVCRHVLSSQWTW